MPVIDPYLVPLGLDDLALAGTSDPVEQRLAEVFAVGVRGKFTLVATDSEYRRLEARSRTGDNVARRLRQLLDFNPVVILGRDRLIDPPSAVDEDPSLVITSTDRVDDWQSRRPPRAVADILTFLGSEKLSDGTDSVRCKDDGLREFVNLDREYLWAQLLGPSVVGRNVRICDYVIAEDVLGRYRDPKVRSGTEFSLSRMNDLSLQGRGPVNVHILTREPDGLGSTQQEMRDAFEALSKRLGLAFRLYVVMCPRGGKRNKKGEHRKFPYHRYLVTSVGTLDVRLLHMSSSVVPDCKFQTLFRDRVYSLHLTSDSASIAAMLNSWRADVADSAYKFEIPPAV
jgi:hypothetical protein